MPTEELLKELLGVEKKKDFDLQRYLRILWRKKHLLIIPLILSWIVAAVGLSYIPNTYVAGSIVAIDPPTTFTHEFQTLLDDQTQNRQRQDVNQLTDVRSEIFNQDFLNGVITTLGINKTPLLRVRAQKLITGPLAGYEVDEVVQRLAAAEIRRRTQVLPLGVGVYNILTEGHSPGDAYSLNQVITQKYVDIKRERELAVVTAKGDFSDEQVALYKEKLNRAEQDLERFKQTQQQVAGQGNPVNQGNVEIAERVMNVYREELKRLELQVGDVRSGLRGSLGFVPSNDQLLSNQDLLTLENKQIHTMLQNLIQYLSSASRGAGPMTEMIEDSSVGLDRQNFRDELISLVDQLYASDNARRREQIVGYYYRLMLVNTFQEIVTSLDRYIGNFRQNLSGTPAAEGELQRRQAEVTKYRDILSTLQQQSTSTQVTRALQASQLANRIVIRDGAVEPLRPIKPNRVRLQLLFVFMGLVAGFVLVVLTEFLNRAFTDVKEIETTLGLPVLGTMPAMNKGPGRAKFQSRKDTLVWMIAMAVFVVVLSGMMLVIHSLYSKVKLDIDRSAVEEMAP